jgi:hypothetical protein
MSIAAGTMVNNIQTLLVAQERPIVFIPKFSDFLLDLHQSFAHQGLAKSLDISIGMPSFILQIFCRTLVFLFQTCGW